MSKIILCKRLNVENNTIQEVIMETLKRSLGVYVPFAKSEIQRALAYRLSFLGGILGNVLQILIACYLWTAIFASTTATSLNGFTKNDMIIYIIFSTLTAMTIGGGTEWIIGGEVQSGEIAINLIRPINYQARLLSQAFGRITWQFTTVFVPIWVGLTIFQYFTSGKLPPHIGTIFIYFVSLFFSFIIWFFFNFCFGLLSFYVTYIWGLNVLKNAVVRFVSGFVIPIVFFPVWFQRIITFLPFASTNYTPVMIYLNKYSASETLKVLLIQVLWIIILYVCSVFFWRKATKKLTIMGG